VIIQWRVVAAGLAVLATTVGCTGSPAQPAPQPPQAASPTTATATLRSNADLGRSIDVFFRENYTGSFRNVRAVLVHVDGRPVVERYYGGSALTTSNVYSVTKSVMSMLIGIALDEGHLGSVNQTLAELLPSYTARMAPQAKAITLRQVLTMSAGLPPDPPSPELPSSSNWVATIVSRGPTQPPGRAFEYSSAGSHLLSAILAEATGQSVLDYARDKLFTPLGIDTEPAAEPVATSQNLPGYDRAAFAWPKDPQGYHLGFGYLKLTAGDMVRLGQLWLDKGTWKGRRLVSAAWVYESTWPHVKTGDPTTRYGYQWWVTSADGRDAYAALGYGGQMIAVVPDLDLVVVVSTDVDDQSPPIGNFLNVVSILIAPAIRGS